MAALHRKKELGLPELIAIAIGGMVGGGIFSILGLSASIIGNLTPISIIIGGVIAALAAYSYVKLALLFKDEGATYSFFKKTYPKSKLAASAIGWFVIFGYVSTLALYAYTFASYAISGFEFAGNDLIRKLVAIGVITVFALINLWSVTGMGKIEDVMVYTKLAILAVISFLLMRHGETSFRTFVNKLAADAEESSVLNILIVASITFVAFEGFQLVINATNEMKDPDKNIPRAIYTAIVIVVLVYVVIALGALFAIPVDDLIENKEFALAAGAGKLFGTIGTSLVIAGAVLATSSAISGTLFGASRQMAVIAADGFFPNILSKRKGRVPTNAIIAMATMASLLVLIGGLELLLEFGSITFLLVSLLMAIANYKLRTRTNSSSLLAISAIAGLSLCCSLILYYEFTNEWEQMIFIASMYIALMIGALAYSKKNRNSGSRSRM